jgi:hypothetical protein
MGGEGGGSLWFAFLGRDFFEKEIRDDVVFKDWSWPSR